MGKKMGRKASSRLAKWAEKSEKAVLKMRSFSQPNADTLATFEKVVPFCFCYYVLFIALYWSQTFG
jgi:hypothetical protein